MLGHAVSHGGVERCILRRILHTSTSGMCSMRLPLGDLVVVFLLSVLAAVSPRTATASKPFTTELMVQNQDVGEVRFSTDGRWIYLEQLLPYREKGYFDRERDWGRSLRSETHTSELQSLMRT